jgi:hypothetical protein
MIRREVGSIMPEEYKGVQVPGIVEVRESFGKKVFEIRCLDYRTNFAEAELQAILDWGRSKD